MVDIAIVGGGPAGLMAAIQAAGKKQVVLLERLNRTGKKLLATGNGRCNFTNVSVDSENYYGNKDFIRQVLNQFTSKDACDFFHSIGLPPKEIDGRLYPNSLQASSVLDMLRCQMYKKGVSERCDFEVAKIKKQSGHFIIMDKQKQTVQARAVIVATGGASGQNLGANGSGYSLLQQLGHTVRQPFPALTPLVCKSNYQKSLHGIRIPAAVTADNGAQKKTEFGEVQFTDYGLSGICVMQVARLFEGGKRKGNITIDALPECSEAEIVSYMENKVHLIDTLEDLLNGLLHKKIGIMVLKELGLSLHQKSETLTKKDMVAIAKKLKAMLFQVVGVKPFVNAQVTAGGIHVDEIYADTMASKLIPGIYVVGELLDVDGDCGGYNLHWSWATGYLAGKAAAQRE